MHTHVVRVQLRGERAEEGGVVDGLRRLLHQLEQLVVRALRHLYDVCVRTFRGFGFVGPLISVTQHVTQSITINID